jgi:heptosyltransferase-2
VIKKITIVKNCKFFLATGKNYQEQIILNKIINSEFKDRCISLDELTIFETLPIIKNCSVSICNDTGFSHLSSALGVKTITLMADTPLIYGSYSSKMYPIIPDGETSVSHNTLGKDKINPDKIYNQLISIIN